MRSLRLIARVVAAVVGGYLFSAGVVTLAALLLGRVMPQDEAVVLTSMLGFLLYLGLLLWAFAEPQLWRLWAVTSGGAVASIGLALWLAPRIGPSGAGL